MANTNSAHRIGGVVHTYQKFNPLEFPSPTEEPPDVVSSAFEFALSYGKYRKLTEEELARAVRLTPDQIRGLGPSIDALIAMLEERKRKLLSTYTVDGLVDRASSQFERNAKHARPPADLRKEFQRAVHSRQIYLLEQLWYRAERDNTVFASQVLRVVESLADIYQIDELVSKYAFTGSQSMDVPLAIEVKKQLEKIDEMLEQLRQAAKTAQIGLIDMEALAEIAPPEDLAQLEELRHQIQNHLREIAERQGLERDEQGQFQLTPKAHRIFQSRLLDRVFSNLHPGRSGRHTGRIIGEGSVELPSTKDYEFGDSIANMDPVQSVLNAMIRRPNDRPVRIGGEDIEIHRTRNNPKCATTVIMDMSGSMRYDGQYIHVKRMALAFQGLIQSEYPGDFLRFIEMYSFAKLTPPGEIIDLMPKPVSIHNPVVRLKVDMSDLDISEQDVPAHFTNIQHALRLARQNLANVDAANKQVVLITDGLPTAHFERETLFLLYPPDPRTEIETMKEAAQCAAEGIVINIFLVPSWSQTEEDIRFAYRMAEHSKGRVFFTAGNDLDRFVLWDYVDRKREILG